MSRLQSLLGAIAETLLISAWRAILKIRPLGAAAELGVIRSVIGFTIAVPGHRRTVGTP
jgi:hypothetical protein